MMVWSFRVQCSEDFPEGCRQVPKLCFLATWRLLGISSTRYSPDIAADQRSGLETRRIKTQQPYFMAAVRGTFSDVPVPWFPVFQPAHSRHLFAWKRVGRLLGPRSITIALHKTASPFRPKNHRPHPLRLLLQPTPLPCKRGRPDWRRLIPSLRPAVSGQSLR